MKGILVPKDMTLMAKPHPKHHSLYDIEELMYPNPIYNLNKHEFHARFTHVDFVWALFSHRSDTLVLGIKPRWSSPSLWPLYWRLAPAECAAAKFFTWGLKSSSSDLHNSGLGFYLLKGFLLRAGFQVTTKSFSKDSQCWKELKFRTSCQSYFIRCYYVGIEHTAITFSWWPRGPRDFSVYFTDTLRLKTRFLCVFITAYFHFMLGGFL